MERALDRNVQLEKCSAPLLFEGLWGCHPLPVYNILAFQVRRKETTYVPGYSLLYNHMTPYTFNSVFQKFLRAKVRCNNPSALYDIHNI